MAFNKLYGVINILLLFTYKLENWIFAFHVNFWLMFIKHTSASSNGNNCLQVNLLTKKRLVPVKDAEFHNTCSTWWWQCIVAFHAHFLLLNKVVITSFKQIVYTSRTQKKISHASISKNNLLFAKYMRGVWRVLWKSWTRVYSLCIVSYSLTDTLK